MTVVLGWWLLPVIVTLVCGGLATWAYVDSTCFSSGSMFAEAFNALDFALFYGAATIVSLISWVIYLALT